MTSTVTGGDQIFAFVFEDADSFAQDPGNPTDTNFKTFGIDETMDTQDREQNPERLNRPGKRTTDEFLETNFDGSWSSDFILTNAHWLRMIYGDPTVSGTDSNTYTFDLNNGNTPRSAHLIEQINYDDGTTEQTVYIGCPATDADFDVSVEDTVGISISGDYVTEKTFSSADGDDMPYGDIVNGISQQPDEDVRPFHYGNSELLLDLDNSGTVDFQSLIQDVSVTLAANTEMEDELGTRFSVARSYLNFEPDVSFTRLVNDNDQDDQKALMYGSSTASEPQETLVDSEIDGEVSFDVGLSAELNKYTFNLSGTFPDSFTRSNVGSIEDVIEEEVDRFVKDVGVVVETDQYDLTN